MSLSASIALGGVIYNQYVIAQDPKDFPKALTNDEIKTLSNSDPNTIIIYPIFTQLAYSHGGFYDYYNGQCSTCNVLHFPNTRINATYNIGKNGWEYLSKLNYRAITDIDVDKNPDILKKYDKIILLHNEYMTKNEFTAIINHPNVLYLYPNSAYVEISVNYSKNTISLVRGHGYDNQITIQYPTKTMNGFNYITSSKNEYDNNCKTITWLKMPNGMALSCFPEYLITYDHSILQTIKDFPKITPILVTPADYSGLAFCDQNGNCSQKLDDVLAKKP